VTAFSFTIGSQSWTLSDAIGPSINLNGSVNPFFRGINADNTFLFAGISFNGATMIVYPEKHFVVGNIGAGPGPLDQFGQPSANDYLGEYTAIGTIAPPVPEPASWALLIVGFGLTGAALRRRRSAFAA
jgi:hypothetical protein